MRIVFLSCDSLKGFVVDDHLLVKELTEDGHAVSTLSWTADADWKSFDMVIIRTTWDYMERPQEFFRKLELISQNTKLFNSIDTVRWNIHKKYLKTLEAKGVTTVPTVFFRHNETLTVPAAWSSEKIVIKPAISAGSYKTMVLEKNNIPELSEGDWMCQPFLPQIAEGEISLVYFQKKFSHALLKVPKNDDFRVQEEFGGKITSLSPDHKLLEIGDHIMSSVEDDLLYARVDLVPYENSYALMELELIEPSLYFRTSPESVKNFSKALACLRMEKTL